MTTEPVAAATAVEPVVPCPPDCPDAGKWGAGANPAGHYWHTNDGCRGFVAHSDNPYMVYTEKRWHAVIYYPDPMGPSLVEPYPKARAENTDGIDFQACGIAVVRGYTRPYPAGDDPQGDWLLGSGRDGEVAFDQYAATQDELTEAWADALAVETRRNRRN